MPRPRKCRKVCCMPERNSFGPLNITNINAEIILMTVDEYETIRLIDLEDMTQEECAKKMDVARTTIQRIYNDARKKLAKSLVEGKILKIKGGDYKICDKSEILCICTKCCKPKAIPNNSEKIKGEEK